MSIALVWFRQDLRLNDNPAFARACNENEIVIPLYVYDDETMVIGSAQKWWLHHSLQALEKALADRHLFLALHKGCAFTIITQLIETLHIDKVYWNRCYEPLMIKRDTQLKQTLKTRGIEVMSSNASLLNEPWTITNQSGGFFKVFTPYWRHCLQRLNVASPVSITNVPRGIKAPTQSITDWHLLPTKPNWASSFEGYWQPGELGAQQKLMDFIHDHLTGYKELRNIPDMDVTSKLSPHLHFGEISPWQIVRELEQHKLNPACDLPSVECFLSEVGWREFSYYLLYHVPTLPEHNYKAEFNAFPWKSNPVYLQAWQKGQTGYPIVDAGMRELWHTGFMHNRVRMIVASFLTKHLLIDWRAGAEWFLDTLLDADLASNSASWQWVAGSGADAAPYYRIFNPILQGEKFDPDGLYIRRWVPELAKLANKYIHTPWLISTKGYPAPLVDHQKARQLALELYQQIRDK